MTTTHTGRPMPEVAPLIRREARRALELDPFETDPHFLLGRGCGRARLQLAGSRAGIPVGHGESVRASRGHWAYAALYLSTFGRFEESRRRCDGPWNKTR